MKSSIYTASGLIFISLILLSVLLSLGCTGLNSDKVSPDNTALLTTEDLSSNITTDEYTLTSFIDTAAIYAKENGKEAAINVFNDENGQFTGNDLYIYAYDFEGNLLAHPYQQDKLGTNRLNWTTVNGLLFVKAAMDTAETGSGFLMYMYPSPVETGTINESSGISYEPKIGFIKKIDEDWWIGSGIYLSDFKDKKTGAMPEIIQNEIDLTTSAVEYAKKNGKETAIEENSKIDGIFTMGNHYVYAYDFEGNLLAHPYFTKEIGKNLYGKTGPYGVHSIETLSKTAANGGGFVVFGWENPSNNNKPELKLGYVLPVDNEWWLGSGVYMSDLTESLINSK